MARRQANLQKELYVVDEAVWSFEVTMHSKVFSRSKALGLRSGRWDRSMFSGIVSSESIAHQYLPPSAFTNTIGNGCQNLGQKVI